MMILSIIALVFSLIALILCGIMLWENHKKYEWEMLQDHDINQIKIKLKEHNIEIDDVGDKK